MILLLGIGQALDALVTYIGVTGGWLKETNTLLAGVVVSPLFIPFKGAVGVWCGSRLKGSKALLVLVVLTFGLVVWNMGCLVLVAVF